MHDEDWEVSRRGICQMHNGFLWSFAREINFLYFRNVPSSFEFINIIIHKQRWLKSTGSEHIPWRYKAAYKSGQQSKASPTPPFPLIHKHKWANGGICKGVTLCTDSLASVNDVFGGYDVHRYTTCVCSEGEIARKKSSSLSLRGRGGRRFCYFLEISK